MNLSKGNRKLSKAILIWNLPRLSTCPGAGDCKNWCYEIKIERMYKQTRPYRMRNLTASRSPEFVEKMVNLLFKKKEPYVRIHESGDFYNQEYLNKWKKIAGLSLDKKFYCFTKSMHLSLWEDLPSNLQIMQSTGSRWDNRIDWKHATNRTISKDEIIHGHEILCPGKGCGDTCVLCLHQSNIHLVGYRHF